MRSFIRPELQTERPIFLVRRLFGGTPYVMEIDGNQWHLADDGMLYVRPLDVEVSVLSVYLSAEDANAAVRGIISAR